MRGGAERAELDDGGVLLSLGSAGNEGKRCDCGRREFEGITGLDTA